jgi:hypothetical protein
MAFCAGSLAPWAGKNSKDLTLEECLDLMAERPPTEWQHELAVTRANSHVRLALERISEVALNSSSRDGKASEYAIIALRNIALRSVRGLKEARSAGLQLKADEYLTAIGESIKE